MKVQKQDETTFELSPNVVIPTILVFAFARSTSSLALQSC